MNPRRRSLRTAASRNDALEFATRTRTNLLFIEHASRENLEGHARVHPVTQLANSLLGLVVFPWEREFAKHVQKLPLSELAVHGWPVWTIEEGSCQTLGELVRHIRNAVAHGHLTFSSAPSIIDLVEIEVSDYRAAATKPYWRARISAADLRGFCLKFVDLLEETIG
jgi:hypothetical protein